MALGIGEESPDNFNGFKLWNYNNERKIAWFRQAEIKHGRVAMAAFVGYCVQANGFRWTFPMTLSGADWLRALLPSSGMRCPQRASGKLSPSSPCSSFSTSPPSRIT